MAGVPGSLFGCSDAGDAGWLRIILQTGLSGCSTQYFFASAVRLSISSRFEKDVAFERTSAILSAAVWLVSLQIGSLGRSAQILSRLVCMAAAGESGAGVE